MTDPSSALPSTPWCIKSTLEEGIRYLKKHGLPEPRVDAELILAHVLGMEHHRIRLYSEFNKPLNAQETKLFGELLRRRQKWEPTAYLISARDFMGLRFYVNSHVLIPRQDTEVLVEVALQILNKQASQETTAPLCVLDLGTGSGCIPLSLSYHLKHVPDFKAWGWELSPQALEVARVNALRLGAWGQRCIFLEKDISVPAHWAHEPEVLWDMITSNPPYIADSETGVMGKDVLDWEPHMALFAPDAGLFFYRILSQQAPKRLKPGGRLLVEVGYKQAHTVKAIFEADGWQGITIHKDYASHERVVEACWSPAS